MDNSLIPQVDLSDDQTSIQLPFLSLSIRNVAKKALVVKKKDEKEYRRGVTMKAGHILSIAAGNLVKDIIARAVLIARSSDNNTITRNHIIEACLSEPHLRFIIPILKTSEIQQFLKPDTLLSRRIASAFTEEQIHTPLAFVAPNPPGRHVDKDVVNYDRDSENSEEISRVIVTANAAYNRAVPSFLMHPHKSRKNRSNE